MTMVFLERNDVLHDVYVEWLPKKPIGQDPQMTLSAGATKINPMIPQMTSNSRDMKLMEKYHNEEGV